MQPTEWTTERVDLLVQLRSEGVRRQLIADHINGLTGSSFTKSSVCGKIDRLFPVAHPRKTPEERYATKQAQRKKDAEKKRRIRSLSRKHNDPARILEAKNPTPRRPYLCREVQAEPHNISLLDLERHHCRYPYGDDPRAMTFCGRSAAHDSSYCNIHFMLCTRPFVEKVAA